MAAEAGGAEAHHARPALLRVLGVVFSLAVVVGGVIGSGIMRAPGLVAQGVTTPAAILVAWSLGGLLSLIAAMPLVEAGASVPRAGGPFPIAERAFGPTAGFLTGWMAWLQYVAANAFIAVVFAEYMHRLHLLEGLSTGLVACGLIAALSGLNALGTRTSGASQTIASAVKGAAFIALAIVLFAAPRAGGHPAPAAAAVVVGGAGALVMAVRVIYTTYAGWDGAIYFSEEVRRPDRSLARATFLGILIVAGLYVLLNAAALHVLTPAAMAGSQLALGDAARVTLGPVGDTVITAVGLFSLAAIVNLQIMASSRITFRMAGDGFLPSFLAGVARRGAPRASVAVVCAASMLFAASGSFEAIVRIYAPWSIGCGLVIALSAIRLRIAEPDLPRPWRMPLFPLPALAAVAIQASLIALVAWDDPVDGLWSALVVAAPLPLWLIFGRKAARLSRARSLKGDAR